MRNIELLLKAAQRIEDIPESYDQTTFFSYSGTSPCGVVACLAGEIIIANGPTVEEGIQVLKGTANPAKLAADLVGIPELYYGGAFGPSALFWPREFKERWYGPDPQEDRTKIAADFLRYLADGGEV